MSEELTYTPGARPGVARPLGDNAGVGDPSSKYFGEMLSAEEEKRIDEKGELVVHGKAWGEAATGLYLTLFAPKVPRDFKVPYGEVLPLNDRTLLWMDAGLGRPRAPAEGYGISLELPSDLGRDPLKARYVSEWIIETVKERRGVTP